jgi:hypothetical protein
MKLTVNRRGNGICSDCIHIGSCPIRGKLKKSLRDVSSPGSSDIEIVIFDCPDYRRG